MAATAESFDAVNLAQPGMAVMKISPKDARLMLQNNIHNRNINDDHVNSLTRALQAGEWKLNYDPIRLAQDGTLLDGQHRLLAVIKSRRSIKALVIWGLPMDTQETIDIGQKRSLAAMLKLRGEKNSATVASILHFIWRYDNNVVTRGATKPTPQALIRILEENPQIRDEVSLVARTRKRLRLAPGLIGGMHHIFSRINEDDADLFFEYLIDPVRVEADDPIYVLRKLVERSAAHPNLAPKPGRMAAYVIKTWNFWRDGEKITTLVWKPTGKRPEPFPEAK